MSEQEQAILATVRDEMERQIGNLYRSLFRWGIASLSVMLTGTFAIGAWVAQIDSRVNTMQSRGSDSLQVYIEKQRTLDEAQTRLIDSAGVHLEQVAKDQAEIAKRLYRLEDKVIR
jgi:hypothetical protein